MLLRHLWLQYSFDVIVHVFIDGVLLSVTYAHVCILVAHSHLSTQRRCRVMCVVVVAIVVIRVNSTPLPGHHSDRLYTFFVAV